MAYRPIKALIHLDALRQNLQQVKAYAPNSKILAIIKANGYGHGIECAAKQLAKADGFGVASIDEAITLRQKGFLHRIVILEGLFSQAELPIAIQQRLDFAIHNVQQLEWLQASNHTSPINVWIKFDTGMHRLGFDETQASDVFNALNNLKTPINLHLMSHFASADESTSFTQQQFELFQKLTQKYDAPKSMANSAAIQLHPESHLDWVRPGIMLYGACASHQSVPNLKPAMTFESEITSLKWIEAGETVGYGQTWTATQKSLIAVVAAGYGDGYPRHAPSGTPVIILGQRMSLAGRVSMDMITVDVTSLADQVELGDRVVLWGKELPVDEIAQLSGTIGYELLCGITQRVPKVEVLL